MSTLESNKLTIDEKAYNYAKIYAALLSDEYQRKRAYASIVALYSFLNLIEQENLNVQKSMTLFRNPLVNEQFEITDLYVNNWHLDVRVMTDGDSVLVPKLHYDNDIKPDFYVVVKVNSALTDAELIGFIDTSSATAEPFDYNYNSVSVSQFISYRYFLNKVQTIKQENFSEEDHKIFNESYLSFMDNNLASQDKIAFIKHLLKCSECRTEFCCFTGFEMVSSSASKYPDIMNDETLSFIGAQKVDDKKYEGKEETIYIGPDGEDDNAEEDTLSQNVPIASLTDEQTISESNDSNKEPDFNEKEQTVSDIIDELFGEDEEYVDEATQTEKPVEPPVLEDNIIESDNDNDNDYNLLDEDTIPNLINDTEEDMQIISDDTLPVLDSDTEEIQTIDEVQNNEDLVVIEKNADIEFIDNADAEEITDEENIVPVDEGTNVQKVIVDYDEFGEPVYSYITGIEEQETSDDAEPYIDLEDGEDDELKEYSHDNEINDNDVNDGNEFNDDEIVDTIPGEYTENDNSPSVNMDDILEYDTENDTENTDNMPKVIDRDTIAEELRRDDIYSSDSNIEEESDEYSNPADIEEDENYDYEYDETADKKAPAKKNSSKLVAAIIGILILLAGITGFTYFAGHSKKVAHTPVENYDTPEVIGDVDMEMDSADADGVGSSDYVPPSSDNTYTPLTEESLVTPPPQPQMAPSEGNINSAIVNSFSQGRSTGVSFKGLNWFCTPELFSDKAFKNYLQNLDNVLKQNLRNNLLNATESPEKDSVGVKFSIDNNGNLQKVMLSDSCGSDEIDNIVLQSINESFNGEKSQILNDSALKSDAYYIKVVIKI